MPGANGIVGLRFKSRTEFSRNSTMVAAGLASGGIHRPSPECNDRQRSG